jgi:6-pyruvoyltetrahydropterin/6-carboxytetrahydropterin synthase
MPHAYTVSVAKEYLTFSAAHFITIAGHQCERLHGHNYRVGVTAAGAVDLDTGVVVEFGEVKEIVRPLITSLDHRVLLPTRNP